MNFLDLTGELLGKVDFEKSKIVQPQKLVFVCGGKQSGKPEAPTSMREILLAKAAETGSQGQLGGARVILAEAAVNFLAESSFSNLLDLERFIAAAVNAVVLIVESPGSMCELGAFVMAPEICQKLIVVMQSDHIKKSSFITSGAIKYFKEQHLEEHDERVLGYHWQVDRDTCIISVPDHTIEGMLSDLPDSMRRVHSIHAKEFFRHNMDGHKVYLTLAFCHLIRAAKLIDLKRCFEFAGIDIAEKKLRHCLDILQICELVKCVRQGKLDYYVALVEQIPFEIAFRDGTERGDRSTSRWITRIVEKIASDNDEKFRIEMFIRRHNG